MSDQMFPSSRKFNLYSRRSLMNISFIKYKISLIHYRHLAAHRPDPTLITPVCFPKKKLKLSELLYFV